MISVSAFSGKTVAVMGLGKSGLSAAEALAEGGAQVWAWDDSADNRNTAAQSGVMLTDIYQEDWGDIETLVLSPGIPGFFPCLIRLLRRLERTAVRLFAMWISLPGPTARPSL